MQTWRQGPGERGSGKQRFWDVSAAEGTGQGCFPWPPALCFDEHTAGFVALGLPSQRDRFRRRSISTSTCPIALEHKLDEAYEQPLLDGWDEENPGSPIFRRNSTSSVQLVRGSRKPRGLCRFAGQRVREAWGDRHGTAACPSFLVVSRVPPHRVYTDWCQWKF